MAEGGNGGGQVPSEVAAREALQDDDAVVVCAPFFVESVGLFCRDKYVVLASTTTSLPTFTVVIKSN